MTKSILLAICGALAGLISVADAAVVQDVDAWAAGFTQAARTTDVDAMVSAIRQVSSDEFNPGKITESLTQVRTLLGDSSRASAEQFEGERFGMFARRVNVAVIGPSYQMYYSVFLTRRPGGWSMDNLTFNNHLEEILKIRWAN